MAEVIEIRDPEVNQQTIQKRIRKQMIQRQADGIDEADFNILSLQKSQQSPVTIDSAPGAESTSLTRALLELTTITTLQEPVFKSSVPIFGPLIVLTRRCWNWMSTKWYVLPILRQQSLVNKRISLIIDELEHWQALQACRLVELETRIEALEARLVQQERQ